MTLQFTLHDVPETKEVEEIAAEIATIFRNKTCDYQQGNIDIVTTSVKQGDIKYSKQCEVLLWLKYCQDLGHTRNCFQEFFDYLLKNYI